MSAARTVLLRVLGVAALAALAGCRGVFGYEDGLPIEDASGDDSSLTDTAVGDADAKTDSKDSATGDSSAIDADSAADTRTEVGDSGIDTTGADADAADTTASDSSADTGVIDSGTDSGTVDSGVVDSGVVDTGTGDTGTDTAPGDTGCVGDLIAYPAATACPDFNWACWKIAPEPAGAGHYTLYLICGDYVVKDNTTKLMWARAEEPGPFGWAAAQVQCSSSKRAGFSDWRMPTRIELASLVDRTKTTSPAIDATFVGASSGQLWTSSPYASMPGYQWFVSFQYGTAYYLNTASGTGSAGVRCVR